MQEGENYSSGGRSGGRRFSGRADTTAPDLKSRAGPGRASNAHGWPTPSGTWGERRGGG